MRKILFISFLCQSLISAQELRLRTDPYAAFQLGIRPLDSKKLEEAIAFGERGGDFTNAPLLMRLETLRNRQRGQVVPGPADYGSAVETIERAPFTVNVVTPYTLAAAMAATAKRKFEPRPTLSIDTLNSEKVVVRVTPGQRFSEADSIENVLIKRASDLLRPLASEVKPSVVQNPMGATRTLAEGRFVFDFSAFDPSMPVTLVLVGQSRNFEWMITQDELARMK